VLGGKGDGSKQRTEAQMAAEEALAQAYALAPSCTEALRALDDCRVRVGGASKIQKGLWVMGLSTTVGHCTPEAMASAACTQQVKTVKKRIAVRCGDGSTLEARLTKACYGARQRFSRHWIPGPGGSIDSQQLLCQREVVAAFLGCAKDAATTHDTAID
jgi:hypothetical protein